MLFFISLLFFVTPQVTSDQSDSQVLKILSILDNSLTGKQLLTQAKKKWGIKKTEELRSYIELSGTSFSSFGLHEQKHQERKIHINVNLNDFDQTLELSHEFVHVLNQPFFDLNDLMHQTAEQFVQSEIEGPGGEAEALMTQCQVAFELNQKTHFCWEKVFFDKKKWIQLLYSVKSEFFFPGYTNYPQGLFSQYAQLKSQANF